MTTTRELRCDCGRVWVPKNTGTVVMKSSVPFGGAPPAPQPVKTSGVKERDVVVPLQIAVVTGVLLALCVLFGGSALFRALQCGVWAVSVIWALTLVLFFISRFTSIEAILWYLEDRFGVDIDGDKHTGEPQKPGHTVINPAAHRPRSWDTVSAADKLLDRREFAIKAFTLAREGMGTGQKAFRGWGLPSRFKVNDRIHAILVQDLINARLAVHVGGNLKFVESITSVGDLMDALDAVVTA